MSAVAIPPEGLAWQRWANELLIAHYGPTTYVKIPDTEGDGGIEGFTCPCGHAYQAYGAEKEKAGRALFDAQRDKMTRDINKFIKNKSLLQKLFGEVKICKWILLVPRVGLKDLKAHANKMTEKVREAKLPYVTDDFFVTYCDEDSFSHERDKILSYKSDCISISAAAPSGDVVDAWKTDNDSLMITLADKLTRLEPGASTSRIAQLQRSMLSWHLRGRELMTKLNEVSPTVYERVFKAKSEYEQSLVIYELTATDASQQLSNVQKGFHDALREAAGSLTGPSAISLVCEAIADWLMRCPLDFPESKTDA